LYRQGKGHTINMRQSVTMPVAVEKLPIKAE